MSSGVSNAVSIRGMKVEVPESEGDVRILGNGLACQALLVNMVITPLWVVPTRLTLYRGIQTLHNTYSKNRINLTLNTLL